MAYCGPAGLSLDEFLKWPQYAQDSALAWKAYEGQRHSCGAHPDDVAEGVHGHIKRCGVCAVADRMNRKLQDLPPEGREGAWVQLSPAEPNRDCPDCMREYKANRQSD